jgi:hypothetical protein
MKAPSPHVFVKVGQVGIIGYRFVGGLPTEASREPFRQTRLASANVSSYQNEMFDHVVLPHSSTILR